MCHEEHSAAEPATKSMNVVIPATEEIYIYFSVRYFRMQ